MWKHVHRKPHGWYIINEIDISGVGSGAKTVCGRARRRAIWRKEARGQPTEIIPWTSQRLSLFLDATELWCSTDFPYSLLEIQMFRSGCTLRISMWDAWICWVVHWQAWRWTTTKNDNKSIEATVMECILKNYKRHANNMCMKQLPTQTLK